MSEFKVGDKVVFKSSSLSACVKNVKEVLRCAGDYYLVWKKDGFHVNLLRHATPEEIAAGHRIDKPSNSGELETLDHEENHISPNCKVGMFEMDKCREGFEKQKYWIGLFRDAVDFDEELGRYVLNGQRKLYAFHLDSFNEKWAIWQEAWQHQQAKVEELQVQLKGAEERAQLALKDKDKYRLERDELQRQLSEYIFVAETLDEMYVKEVKSSEELQKRADKAIRLLVEAELYQSEPNIDLAVKALKGKG